MADIYYIYYSIIIRYLFKYNMADKAERKALLEAKKARLAKLRAEKMKKLPAKKDVSF